MAIVLINVHVGAVRHYINHVQEISLCHDIKHKCICNYVSLLFNTIVHYVHAKIGTHGK